MAKSSAGSGFKYASAIALHSMCQPGRPAPKGEGHDGSPGRAANQTKQSSTSFFPIRSGSPPR